MTACCSNGNDAIVAQRVFIVTSFASFPSNCVREEGSSALSAYALGLEAPP